MSKVLANRSKAVSGECPTCAANGRNPNRETLEAIAESENDELYEYTGPNNSSMMRKILEGNDLKLFASVDEMSIEL